MVKHLTFYELITYTLSMYFKHFKFIIILKKCCFYSVLKAEDFKSNLHISCAKT